MVPPEIEKSKRNNFFSRHSVALTIVLLAVGLTVFIAHKSAIRKYWVLKNGALETCPHVMYSNDFDLAGIVDPGSALTISASRDDVNVTFQPDSPGFRSIGKALACRVNAYKCNHAEARKQLFVRSIDLKQNGEVRIRVYMNSLVVVLRPDGAMELGRAVPTRPGVNKNLFMDIKEAIEAASGDNDAL